MKIPPPNLVNCKMSVDVDIEKGYINIHEEFMNRISTWRINTLDALVREGLIKLGWTPPPELKG